MAVVDARRMLRRAFLKGVAATALFSFLPRAWAKVLGYPRAMQGPMIGAPGPRHFTVFAPMYGWPATIGPVA